MGEAVNTRPEGTIDPTEKTTPQDPTWIVEKFRQKAHIRPFAPGSIPTCSKPKAYNNDLELGSFKPIKYTWAGEQRKGATCHITDSVDRMGHTRKAFDMDFFLAKPVPLPAESLGALEFIQTASVGQATDFWTSQLSKVREVVAAAESTQAQWEACIPANGRGKPPSLRAVALLHLMQQST